MQPPWMRAWLGCFLPGPRPSSSLAGAGATGEQWGESREAPIIKGAPVTPLLCRHTGCSKNLQKPLDILRWYGEMSCVRHGIAPCKYGSPRAPPGTEFWPSWNKSLVRREGDWRLGEGEGLSHVAAWTPRALQSWRLTHRSQSTQDACPGPAGAGCKC
jgi:hypothetical protein